MNGSQYAEAGLGTLIRFFEQIYCQNIAMKTILEKVPSFDWKPKLLEALRDIEDEGVVKERFSKLYESIDSPAFREVIQEFLNVKHTH